MVSTVARSPGAQSAAVTRRAVTRPITVISFGFLHQSSAEKARIESRSTCSLRQTVSTGLTRPLESGVSIPLLRSNDPHLIYMIAVAQLQCEVAVANRSDAEIIAGLFGDLQSRFLCLQSSRDYERSHGGGVLPVNAPVFLSQRARIVFLRGIRDGGVTIYSPGAVVIRVDIRGKRCRIVGIEGAQKNLEVFRRWHAQADLHRHLVTRARGDRPCVGEHCSRASVQRVWIEGVVVGETVVPADPGDAGELHDRECGAIWKNGDFNRLPADRAQLEDHIVLACAPFDAFDPEVSRQIGHVAGRRHEDPDALCRGCPHSRLLHFLHNAQRDVPACHPGGAARDHSDQVVFARNLSVFRVKARSLVGVVVHTHHAADYLFVVWIAGFVVAQLGVVETKNVGVQADWQRWSGRKGRGVLRSGGQGIGGRGFSGRGGRTGSGMTRCRGRRRRT